MDSFPYKRLWLIFMLLATALIFGMERDLRPVPVHPELWVEEDAPTLEPFVDGEWVHMEFEAPRSGIRRIYWKQLTISAGQRIEVKLENLSRGGVVWEGIHSEAIWQPLLADNEAGDRMKLSFRWQRPELPVIYTGSDGVSGATLQVEGASVAQPLFQLSTEKEFPILPDPSEAEGWNAWEVPVEEPLVIDFTAESADLRALYFPGLLQDDQASARVTMTNESRGGEQLKFTVLKEGNNVIKTFTPGNDAGDQLRISIEARAAGPPSLLEAKGNPEIDLLVQVGDQTVEFDPLFRLGYRWPTQHLLWGWALVALTLGWTFSRPGILAESCFLLSLGLMGIVTSLLFWQQNYSVMATHLDPDRYGLYGEMLRDYIQTPERRGEIEEWMAGYPHAYVALVPVLLGLLYLAGLSKVVGYVLLVSACSFGTLLLARHFLRRHFQMEGALLVTGILAIGTHLVFLKSFASPSTDMVGLCSNVAMLCLLAWRGQGRQPMQLMAAILLGIALVFVRPAGPVYLFFFGVAFVLIDCIRDRRFYPVERMVTILAVAGPATLIFFGCFFAFGWAENLALAREKSLGFHDYITLERFWKAAVPVFSLFPLLWIGLRVREKSEIPAVGISLAWIAAYMGLLALTQAPWLPRLFLPVVPPVILLAVAGMRGVQDRVPWLVPTLVILLAIFNVGVTIWIIDMPFLPPPCISGYFYN